MNTESDLKITNEIGELFERIAGMRNVYGFCARHYVTQEHEIILLIHSINKALLEGKLNVDKELEKDIMIFSEARINK